MPQTGLPPSQAEWRLSSLIAAGIALAVATVFIPAAASAQARTTQIDIGAMRAGQSPAGFDFARTGGGGPGEWRVVADPTAAGGKAIAQLSADTTDYRFPLAIYHPIDAGNVVVSLRFKPIRGSVDQAGGIVIRLKSPGDYYVLRANAREDNVNFYRVVDGSRGEIRGVDAKVARNVWHRLELRAQGDRFTALFDGNIIFTVRDGTFAGSGKVGLWTKADSVSEFDTIAITPFD
jgi:hypothetical protein